MKESNGFEHVLQERLRPFRFSFVRDQEPPFQSILQVELAPVQPHLHSGLLEYRVRIRLRVRRFLKSQSIVRLPQSLPYHYPPLK